MFADHPILLILTVFVLAALILRARYSLSRRFSDTHWINRMLEGRNRKHRGTIEGGSDTLSTGAWDDVYQMEGYTPKAGETYAAEKRRRQG